MMNWEIYSKGIVYTYFYFVLDFTERISIDHADV